MPGGDLDFLLLKLDDVGAEESVSASLVFLGGGSEAVSRPALHSDGSPRLKRLAILELLL